MHASISLAVDFVSAPFCVSKSHIYEGIENPDTFFRPALRSLLVNTICMLQCKIIVTSVLHSGSFSLV